MLLIVSRFVLRLAPFVTLDVCGSLRLLPITFVYGFCGTVEPPLFTCCSFTFCDLTFGCFVGSSHTVVADLRLVGSVDLVSFFGSWVGSPLPLFAARYVAFGWVPTLFGLVHTLFCWFGWFVDLIC